MSALRDHQTLSDHYDFMPALPPTGLMVSSFLDNEATALELAIGIFYPLLFIGGVYTAHVTMYVVIV